MTLLNERTTLVVKSLKAGSGSAGFWGRLRLRAGSLMASLAGFAGPAEGLEIETGTAVAAVKGTTFAVEAAAETTTVSVLEGSVETAGLSAEGKRLSPISVKEGQETSVDPGSRRPKTPWLLSGKAHRATVLRRMKAVKDSARKHREMRKSGELQALRKLRHLARTGRLDEADADLRDYMKKNPRVREQLQQHGQRHQQLKRGRGGAPERVRQQPSRPSAPKQRGGGRKR